MPLAAAAAAFALVATSLLRRAEALDLPAYDSAFFEQVVWNLGHGRGFSSGFFPSSLLGIHFSPLLALPATLEIVWPDARLLSLLHALALAFAAPAAFLFLRALLEDRPGGEWMAAALAAPLPFWAELQQAARADFHTEALGLPLVLIAGWAGLRGRGALCWLFALLALTAREDQAYAAAVVGLLLFLFGPSRRLGAAVLVVALLWLVAAQLVLIPAFRGSAASQIDYYRWLHTASPTEVLAALVNPAGWLAFAGMLASVAGLALLRPGWFALALPPLAGDLLSSHYPQPELLLHYGLPLVVPLLVAGGLGARRVLEWPLPRLAPVLVTAPAVLVGAASGPLLWGTAPLVPAPALAQLRVCTSSLPAGAAVAADDAPSAPLAARPLLRPSDRAIQADYLVLDRQGRLPDYVDVERRDALLAALPGQRRLICDDGRFQLWSPARG